MAPLYNRAMATDHPHFFDPATEQGVLRLSIAGALLLAAAAVVFGLLANSSLIIFDGIYGLIDGVNGGSNYLSVGARFGVF